MKKIEVVGGAYQDRSLNLNAQECINLFPRMDPSAKYVQSLLGTPGLVAWKDAGHAAEIRGIHRLSDNTALYAVIGDRFYSFAPDGTATQIGTLITSTGQVYFAEGYTHVMCIDGTDGWYKVKASGDFIQITDVDFPTPKYLTYQDQYYIVISSGTDEIWISAQNDPTSWSTLDYASAEGAPDTADVVISDRRELFIFGKQTTEVFYNSGNADFPFERTPSGFIEIGIGAPDSAAKLDNSIFWLDDHYLVRRIENYNGQIVSTRPIEYQISQLTSPQTAIGYGYTQEGHAFYVLTFPDDNITFVYDAATGFWHKRGSWPLVSGLPGRHRSNCYAFFNNKHLIGDFESGIIYELDLGTYDEVGNELVDLRTFRAIHAERQRMFIGKLVVELETGTGTGAGAGIDPQVILRWSDDDGHNWSNESWSTHSKDIGAIGAYSTRVQWRRLGHSRSRIFSIKITDPVKRVILAGFIDFDLEK